MNEQNSSGSAEKLSALEQRLGLLEKRVQYLEDRNEIENLMACHQFYMAAQAGERIVRELWTSDEKEASIEYGASGVYEGLWKVKTFYISDFIPGCLHINSLTTQRIEIDGDTARGSWIAVGMELDAGDLGPAKPGENEQRQFLLSSTDADGNRYKSEWQWQRINVTFHREEDKWKIHNLHVKEYFRSPYDVSPVEYASRRFVTDGMWLESMFETPLEFPPEAHGENLPSGPSTTHWQYTIDCDARKIED